MKTKSMTKENFIPTHRNIFTGVKVMVTGNEKEYTLYTREVENDGLKVLKDFKKETYSFKQCYEEL